MKIAPVIYLFALILIAPALASAEGLSLGLGYPYASVKYDFSALSAEGRFVSGSGVRAYTGRAYWNFYQADNLKAFSGLEGGYIKFDTLDLAGTGSEGAIFVGAEYFITDRISLLTDFSPTVVALKSGDFGVSGVEYVVNFAFYWHFGDSAPKPKAHANTDSSNDKPVSARKQDAKASVVPAKESVKEKTPSVSRESSVLITQLQSDDWRKRRNAAFELGKMKAAEAVPFLFELLEDENDSVCGAAVVALGRIGDKTAFAALCKRLQDASVFVRISAARGLGYMGDKRAIKYLESVSKDESPKVRAAVAAALKELRGDAAR